MAEPVNTTFENAILDAKTLEKFVNGSDSENASPRLTTPYPTIKKAVRELFEKGGLPASPFANKAIMLASPLVDGDYAMVTNDGDNNGLYVKLAGVWVKSSYDPVSVAKSYADENKLDIDDVEISYIGGNIIGAKSKRRSNFGVNSIYQLTSESYYDSVVVPVNEGETLYLHNDKGVYNYPSNASFILVAENPYKEPAPLRIRVLSESILTDTNSGISHYKMRVPVGAKYLILNTRFTSVGGVRTDYEWSIHRGAFNPSYESGREYVNSINGASTQTSEVYPSALYRKSATNLFSGEIISFARMFDLSLIKRPHINDVIAEPIPVDQGKTYTVSGINPSLTNLTYVQGLNSNGEIDARFVSTLAEGTGSVFTVTINNPSITHISFSLSVEGYGTVEQVKNLSVQVEEGSSATYHQPYISSDIIDDVYAAIDDVYAAIDKKTSGTTPPVIPVTALKQHIVTKFDVLNSIKEIKTTTLKALDISAGSMGLEYSLQGVDGVDSTANTVYTQVNLTGIGKQDVHVHLMNELDGARVVGGMPPTMFDIPSSMLDNPDTFPNLTKTYPTNIFVHPSIAYSATPVAGFKYWMIASGFPPMDMGDAEWEDEDMFVSNDGENWQRIRSLYETDKSYTHPTFKLPPQSLVTKNARRNAFLPSPSQGDVIEISIDATSEIAAIDRELVTLVGLPWKHDPFLLIDGGYVYTYHTFHLGTATLSRFYSAFIVCVRTNDGINWDVVRTDGSTMRLTEENSKTIFTKDAQGRYNYMYCLSNGAGQNPEIVKYGDGDYCFYYGSNFAYFFTGTTPYSFDLSSKTVIEDKGAGNHPCLLYHDNVLYQLTDTALYSSTNRGVTFTKQPYYPVWVGGISGVAYKRTMCIGEGGKVTLYSVERTSAPSASLTSVNGISISNNINQMFLYEYPSFSSFLSASQVLVNNAYVDIQMAKINYGTGKREVIFSPSLSAKNTGNGGNYATQRIKFADIDVEDGDVLFIYATLNARGKGKIIFGGIDIT